ncbi:hypothetical protein ACFL6U_20920 [Planctomycetota bacterium]
MVRRKIICFMVFVFVMASSAVVQADLRLVENFETLEINQNPDGQPCTGVLGGVWDTEVDGTGSIKVAAEYDSISIGANGLSDGTEPRAFGFNGINNSIEKTESGIVCLRFRPRVSADNRPFRAFMGFITDTSDDPVNTESAGDPTNIPLAVYWVSDESGETRILSADGETVLKTSVARNQWYNVWLMANNVTDTFDLYLRAVAADEAVTLPSPIDLVQANIPFTEATNDPLTGMLVSIPAGPGQGDRVNVSEIWWDGDQGIEDPTTATKPVPTDEDDDVARDVVLSWRAAALAEAHDVYFGEDEDDVTNATVNDPRGVLVRPAHDTNTYAPETLLELGKTYYWRVDEVNNEHADSPFVGWVWSFEVEPVAIVLTQENMVEVTASSSLYNWIPSNTINGSGLDPNGGHDVVASTMWAGTLDDGDVSIEYAFDHTYKMYDMRVWNHNTTKEVDDGFGMKDVVVSTSTDGVEWTPVENVNLFNQASGEPDYQANTIVDFNGVLANRVRITCSDNWGDKYNYVGLSQVAFGTLPVYARLPQPPSGDVDVNPSPTVLLSWRPGRTAAQHMLYLSTDEQAVIDGTAQSLILDDAEYPALNLDVNAVYYWRVDEVNEAEVWPGEVWNFSTVEMIQIDDFEGYNNNSPFIVFQKWVDGYGFWGDGYVPEFPGNGTRASVGHDIWSLSSPHFLKTIMDRDNPHGGVQCMPVYYQNSETPYVSEAIRTFNVDMDWSGNDVDALCIWYLGSSTVDSFSYDSGTQTYSVIAAGGNIAPAGGTADTFHFVYKPLSGNGEMVVKVESIDLVDPWSKAGLMIRQGLETGARHAFIGLSPSQGATFAWRKAVNGQTETMDVPSDPPPYWLKLVRSGDTITSYMSANGRDWELIGPATVYMSGDIYIGMAVSSHESRTDPLCEAIFSNVSTRGGVAAGVFTESASVSEQPLNMSERLYVTISDSAGSSVEVELDAVGTAVNEWTLGTVDLTSLPINIASIKEVAIGVGDGSAGTTGVVLIDDIYLLSTD